jgi:hypothetical protein
MRLSVDRSTMKHIDPVGSIISEGAGSTGASVDEKEDFHCAL